jgi:hypothetical protein
MLVGRVQDRVVLLDDGDLPAIEGTILGASRGSEQY